MWLTDYCQYSWSQLILYKSTLKCWIGIYVSNSKINKSRLSSVIVQLSVVLKRTFSDSDWRFTKVSGSDLQSQVGCLWSVNGIYVSGDWHDWSVKLRCDWLSVKTREKRLAGFDVSPILVSLLLVKLSAQFIACLFRLCRSSVICTALVAVDITSVVSKRAF